MQLKVDAVGPQRTSQYGDYFAIKSGDQWYNIQGERDTSLLHKTVEWEGKQNRSGWWGKLKASTPPSTQTSEHANGRTKLNQFEFADVLEFYWEKLKPWELADEAKASVLCTCLIATADGRIMYEFPPDEVNPFAGEPGE